jgi:cytochrome c5
MKELKTFASIGTVVSLCAAAAAVAVSCSSQDETKSSSAVTASPSDGGGTDATPGEAILAGQKTFRFDTFGDEAFWGDALKLHQAIEGQAHGGVGAGVSPKAALAAGLKVDATALPSDVVAGVKSGAVNLDDPATTLALLGLDAVVGVKGIMNADGSLKSVGITCALCHSTVDNSFAPGIGNRLDGWANRDLNVGAIIDLSPDLTAVATLLGVDQATVRNVVRAWGPGKFDAELVLDGKGFRPDGKTAATLIPPAFGMAGVNLHTFVGWGSVPYWNAFVAVLEMHGQGNFTDERLDNAEQFPVAARNKLGHVRVANDLVSSKLPDLHVYQLSIAAPKPDPSTFDAAAAKRGNDLYIGAAKCATCHVAPTHTEPGFNMHTAQEIGIDDFQANRGPEKRYRTTPLPGLWTHQKGGFFHDGRFATLLDVVNHYDTNLRLGLTDAQKTDLVEYLKSL